MPTGIDPVDKALTRASLEYTLPEAAIAQTPIEPRDAARLLDTRDLTDRVFSELPDLLEPGDLVVVNETKVRRARLHGVRPGTGGKVELLVLNPVGDGSWECLCRPARRLRPGVDLEFDGLVGTIERGPDEGRVWVRFDVPEGTELEDWFERVGETPLPPYFHGEVEPDRYQTMFADPVGSAAAPTAALHFTPEVVAACKARGIRFATVELRVGLDTFRPVTAERLADHEMHEETFRVPQETVDAINETHAAGGRVIAVGTTVTRTLESAWTGETVVAMEGATDLFITPGFRFRVIDGLITNFHVPGSTLIALVSAALGPRWRDVYETALERGYRFLSFGDAMFIEVRSTEYGVRSSDGRRV